MFNPPPRLLVASLTFVLGVIVAITASVYAWTGPTAPPPGANVSLSLLGQWTSSGSNIYFSGGNVGIQNASPTVAPLVIGATPTVKMGQNAVGGVDQLDLANTTGNAYLYAYSTANTSASLGAYNGTLGLPLLLNPAGGNVGVGTSSPAQKFSVNGVVYTTGGVQFGDGTTQTTAGGAGGGQPHMQVFTTSGTFTTPVGTSASTVYKFTVVGGGGGGGGGTDFCDMGGGGGGGGAALYESGGVAPGINIPVTVGAGGVKPAIGAGTIGTTGGLSRIVFNGITVTGNGGAGGVATAGVVSGGCRGTPGAGGSGGTATGGTLNISGRPGTTQVRVDAVVEGGESFVGMFGHGGTGANVEIPGGGGVVIVEWWQ